MFPACQLGEDAILEQIIVLVLQVSLHSSALLNRGLIIVERAICHQRFPLLCLMRVVTFDLEPLELNCWIFDIVIRINSLGVLLGVLQELQLLVDLIVELSEENFVLCPLLKLLTDLLSVVHFYNY